MVVEEKERAIYKKHNNYYITENVEYMYTLTITVAHATQYVLAYISENGANI